MKRIIMLMAVAAMTAVMLVGMAAPAMAQTDRAFWYGFNENYHYTAQNGNEFCYYYFGPDYIERDDDLWILKVTKHTDDMDHFRFVSQGPSTWHEKCYPN